MSTTLPDGLVLRTATQEDLDRVGDLLARRGEPDDALDHRLVVDDPDAGLDACAVVVDAGRVVSTATLLDETLWLGGVGLPAGQVDLVATDTGYEGRGLVRALMNWAHDRSASRGHLLQVMVGIPYFYRLFGYAYAVDHPAVRPLVSLPPVGGGGGHLRPAAPGDIPALVGLQDAAQAGFDVRVPHSDPRWRWLLAQGSSTTWVVERAGDVVATGRTTAPDDGEVLLAEAAALDHDAAADLLHGVARLGGGSVVRLVDRPGTVVHTATAGHLAPAGDDAEQYYVRLPDPAALLDALRPVLSARLAASGLDRVGRDVVLSTFGAHHRLPVTDAGLGPVSSGGVMQAPGAHGGAGVAPDHLAALLFGGLGMAGLRRLRPDVYPGPDAELFEVLFPPVSADLLTYYLPY